jgi:cation-transporting P-type ATPase E
VLRFAVPTGLLTATAVYIGYRIARSQQVTGDEARTAATIVIMVIGLWVLVLLARPLKGWKLALIATMAGLFVLALAVPGSRSFFALNVPFKVLVESSALGVAGAAGVTIGWRFARAVQRRVEAGR